MLLRSAKLEKAKSIKTNSRISFKLILVKAIFYRFYFLNSTIRFFLDLSSYLSIENPLTLKLSIDQREKLLGFAEVFIPELKGENDLLNDFVIQFEKLFFSFDRDTQKKLLLFISVLSFLSYFYTAKAYKRLSFDQQKSYLARIYNFPFAKIVSGFTGLRTLCFISYYSIKEVWKTIHYDGPLVSR